MARYQNDNNSSSGLGLGAVLTVVFVVLKLCGLINWSWWWVLSPLWISFGVLLVVTIIVYAVLAIINWIRNRKRGKK